MEKFIKSENPEVLRTENEEIILSKLRFDEEGNEKNYFVFGIKAGTKESMLFNAWFTSRPTSKQKFYSFKTEEPGKLGPIMFIVKDEEESKVCRDYLESII